MPGGRAVLTHTCSFPSTLSPPAVTLHPHFLSCSFTFFSTPAAPVWRRLHIPESFAAGTLGAWPQSPKPRLHLSQFSEDKCATSREKWISDVCVCVQRGDQSRLSVFEKTSGRPLRLSGLPSVPLQLTANAQRSRPAVALATARSAHIVLKCSARQFNKVGQRV